MKLGGIELRPVIVEVVLALLGVFVHDVPEQGGVPSSPRVSTPAAHEDSVVSKLEPS
jgi:hypothetical protein